jgi:hypothetical protein
LISIRIPAVQNYAKKKVLNSISEQYGAEWSIEDIRITFFDELEATGILFRDQKGDTLFQAQKVHIDIGLFSFLNKTIHIDDIVIEESHIKLYELSDGKMNYDFLIPKKDSIQNINDDDGDNQIAWDYDLESVILKKTIFSYSDNENHITIDHPLLDIDLEEINITQKTIQLNTLISNGHLISIESDSNNTENEEFTIPTTDWNIVADKIDISQDGLLLDAGKTIVSGIKIKANDLNYHNDSVVAEFSHIEGQYGDLIIIENAEGKIELSKGDLHIEEFQLKTKRDYIESADVKIDLNAQEINAIGLVANVTYNTLNKFKDHLPPEIQLKKGEDLRLKAASLQYKASLIDIQVMELSYGRSINISGNFLWQAMNNDLSHPDRILVQLRKLSIDIDALSHIVPEFSIPEELLSYKQLYTTGIIEGNLDHLILNRVNVRLDDALDLISSGTINNIRDKENISYDFDLINITADIQKNKFVTSDKIAIDSLGKIKYDGTLSGNKDDIVINGNLKTDIGAVTANLKLGIAEGIDKLKYKGELRLEEFDIGKFLRDDKLNKLTLSTTLDGQGINLKEINSNINGQIQDFEYKGYIYKQIELNAIVKDGLIDGEINVNDPNARLYYNGIIEINDEHTLFNFSAEVEKINLQTLNLYNSELNITGNIKSRFELPLRKDKNHFIHINDLKMDDGELVFNEQQLNIDATKLSDSTFISIKGEAIDLKADGIYSIRDLPSSINELAQQYFNTDTIIAHRDKESESLNINGKMNTLKPFQVLYNLNNIDSKAVDYNIALDFKNNNIESTISLDSFYYADFFSEKIKIKTKGQADTLTSDMIAINNEYKFFQIANLEVNNTINDNTISTKYLAEDSDNIQLIQFESTITPIKKGLSIRLKDDFRLNDKPWTIDHNNEVQIENGLISVHNFDMSDGEESLSIYSTEEEAINLEFGNYNLSHFTKLILGSNTDISGIMNGKIEAKNLDESPYFIANVNIAEMKYDTTNVGILTIKGDVDPNTSLINTALSIQGKQNDVTGYGNYNISTTALDFELHIESLELKLLDPFVNDIITDSEGYLAGVAKLSGTADNPKLNGEATFHKALTTVVVNNSRYGIDNHTIYFDDKSIDIGILDIYDIDNNVATLTGNIYHEFLRDFYLEIIVETSKFIFLNTTSSDNPVLYGRLVMDAVGDISGPPDLLEVDVIATSLRSSDITISPFSGETYLQKEDFITYGKPADFEDLSNEYLLKLAQQYPFNVNLLLDVTEDSKLTFVVDPISGDRVSGRGNSSLRIKLSPDGQQEIYGNFVVSEGDYLFTYGDFITKNFKIKEGGTVTFSGDPLDAILDIDAIYTVYTTTFELIQNTQSITNNSNEISDAQSPTNVDVYLSLKETLSDPNIVMDIQVPDLQSSSLVSAIDRRLNELRSNTNELNNQVFGLLIFDSFIISDNNSTGFENVGQNIALSSISNLVSNQLNNLAQEVIKGVDFNINVNSYDSDYINNGSGGNVTELGLQVTKQLFNDRLSISATGNVDLEGNNNSAASYTSFIGDFLLEYKITEDGRYRLRVFSKSDYDRLVNENTNKNGVSLFFKKSFDSKQ